MKINIYYGGRGLLDDPTLYVLNKMEEVLNELRVTVQRYNIYEHKNEIATLPQTIGDEDELSLRRRSSGLELVDICSNFWMHAGFMVIKRRSAIPICSQS